MIEIIEGSIFDTKAKFIAHQVNCQKKMGSGIALQVKKRYPHVYEEYMKVCSSDMLGQVQIIPINQKYLGYDSGSLAVPYTEQYICNLFAQSSYGYDGKQYTSIDALRECFKTIKWITLERNNNFGATIAMPYKIGCVRGGADWGEVYHMIETILNDCKVELWRLDKG